MKLDVEGLEFAIVPAMVRAQALCTLDAVRIEWHTRFWGSSVAATAARARNLSDDEAGASVMDSLTHTIRAAIPAAIRRAGPKDCRTELIDADDETYMHDRKAWPAEAICTPPSGSG